jgi:hypothetical protein
MLIPTRYQQVVYDAAELLTKLVLTLHPISLPPATPPLIE